MFKYFELVLLAVLVSAVPTARAQDTFQRIGREATPAELRAWDIDVRPDFLGLPPGSGNVAKGREVFLAKCAACHGAAGESNAMFTPLIGGTTKEDIASGRVKSLSLRTTSERTMFMKVNTLSTLFDYIQRAMPWSQPKSLTTNEVYSVLAYLLNLADVVPENFTLRDITMAEVQQRLPNRNGMTTDHGLWPGASTNRGGIGNGGQPDLKIEACMSDCRTEIRLGPPLPESMRKAQGDLAEQTRAFGPVRGTSPRPN